MANNELKDFIRTVSNRMADEYVRIQKRATEDPGTAGDQGEENWASLLREWLPPIFQVVTKGRIINYKGVASPQVDVIILRPEYPRGLIDKKLYLADGVLAAFECKLTLKNEDFKKFFNNSVVISKLVNTNYLSNVYNELQSPVVYGLLSHSHCWKPQSHLVESIFDRIHKFDQEFVTHPREMPDLICIADTACWYTMKFPLPVTLKWNDEYRKLITVSYNVEQIDEEETATPIASFLNWLLFRLSKEHSGLWNISRYFTRALLANAMGYSREWPLEDVFSEATLKELRKIQSDKGYNYPSDWKFLGMPPP